MGAMNPGARRKTAWGWELLSLLSHWADSLVLPTELLTPWKSGTMFSSFLYPLCFHYITHHLEQCFRQIRYLVNFQKPPQAPIYSNLRAHFTLHLASFLVFTSCLWGTPRKACQDLMGSSCSFLLQPICCLSSIFHLYQAPHAQLSLPARMMHLDFVPAQQKPSSRPLMRCYGNWERLEGDRTFNTKMQNVDYALRNIVTPGEV